LQISCTRPRRVTLMLEPLFRCNLACAGCGKIQYPAHILKSNRTFRPRTVSMLPTNGARKKYVYLCTNAAR
jgi:hypothetical protein